MKAKMATIALCAMFSINSLLMLPIFISIVRNGEAKIIEPNIYIAYAEIVYTVLLFVWGMVMLCYWVKATKKRGRN